MKTIFLLILIFLNLAGSAQVKHLVKDGSIIYTGPIPEKFQRDNGEYFPGGYNTRTDLHQGDGWKSQQIPEYNPVTHKLGDPYYSPVFNLVTFAVTPKTAQEIQQEQDNLIQSLEYSFNPQSAKRILAILARHLLESDSITQDKISDLATIYPPWKPGTPYKAGDVLSHENNLYSVIQAHTSQSDWRPENTASLFKQHTPPGEIPDWKQPAGAHDTYQAGDKVKFNGNIYESLINNNSWSPTAYPQGWKQIN